jgi:hypothetical protein
MLRAQLASPAKQVCHASGAMAQQSSQGHAVGRLGVRGVRRMGVEVGIDPDQAQRTLRPQVLCHGAPGTHRTGMVATQHQRLLPLAKHLLHRQGQALGKRLNGVQAAGGQHGLSGHGIAPGDGTAGRCQRTGNAMLLECRRAPFATAIAGALTDGGADDVHYAPAHAALRSAGRAAVAQANRSLGSVISGTSCTVLPKPSCWDSACT